MTTVTVSEATAERWQRTARARGMDPEELLLRFLDDWEEIAHAPLTPEDRARIGRGLAELQAGEGIDGDLVFDQVIAGLEAKSGVRHSK